MLSSQTDGRHVMHRIDRVRRIWNGDRDSTLATLFSIRPRVMECWDLGMRTDGVDRKSIY